MLKPKTLALFISMKSLRDNKQCSLRKNWHSFTRQSAKTLKSKCIPPSLLDSETAWKNYVATDIAG